MVVEVEEIRKLKEELEQEILMAVSHLNKEFYNKTRLTPNSISVYMAEVGALGEKYTRHIVSGVGCTIDL